MNIKTTLSTLALSLFLFGCGQPTPNPNPSPQVSNGLVSLPMYIGKEQGENLPIPETNRSLQTAMVRSSFPGSTAVTFSQISYTMRIYNNPERWYITANYKVTNISTNPLSNLTLIAKSRNGADIGGTAITSMVDGNNQPISDVQTARNFQPSNYLKFSDGLVNPNFADFQAFTTAEASQIQTTATSSGVALTADDFVLNYGFVSRLSNTSRVIPAVSCKTSPSDPCNVGNVSVTFKAPAFQLAGVTPTLPLKLTYDFLLSSEASNRVTRSDNETTASAVARATTLGATQVALVGADSDVAGPPFTTIRVPEGFTNHDFPQISQASIDLDVPIGTAGSSLNFDASGSAGPGITYLWNFGDSTTSTSAVVSHNYTAPGLYSVGLTVTDNTGHQSQKTMQVTVLPEIQNISPNLSLQGSDVASFDAGTPLPGFAYNWDFGDATTGTTSKLNHTYTALGTYVVKLKIIDNRPLYRSKSGRISGGGSIAYQNETWLTRWEVKPRAKFSLSSSAGANASFGIATSNTPYTVNFNASASTGSTALSYSWTFGDNTTGTGAQASHAFGAGENIVTLTVTDSKGQKDTYKAYVVAKLQEPTTLQTAFFRPMFTYPSTTRARSTDPFDLLPASKSETRTYAQAKSTRTGANYIDYFPYIMHKSATLSGVSTRWNAWSNTLFRQVFCNTIFTYYNGVQTNNFQFINTDIPTLCQFVKIRNIDIPVLKAQGNSELFVTSSLYDQTYRFDVIGGLRVPKIYIAVVPDKMIPGNEASPYVTENIGNFNGTRQLMLTVRIRQSDVLSNNLKFKVPVYAVDDNGALMTTANGNFKAAFKTTNPLVSSDCGDCVMENGKSFIEFTMPSNAFPLTGAQIDLTQISMYGNPNCGVDNSAWIATMPDFGRLDNCTTVTATYDPPTGISGIPDYKYPIPAESAQFFGHVLIGADAAAVTQWRSYLQDGIWDDAKNFVINFIPTIGSGKNFMATVKACQTQECGVLGVGAIVLAGVGVVVDVLPVTHALYAKFAGVFKISRFATKGISNGLEQVIKEGVDATKTVDGLGTDLETTFGNVAKSINECGPSCSGEADNVVKAVVDRGALPKDALLTLNKATTEVQATAIPINCFLSALDEMKEMLVSGAMTVKDMTLLFFGVDVPSLLRTSTVQTKLNPSSAKCPYGQLDVNIRATVGSGPGGRGTKLYDGIPTSSTGKPQGTSPHHIVPLKEFEAARCVARGGNVCDKARSLMGKYGIDLNDGDNGVFLPYNASSDLLLKYRSATIHNRTSFHNLPYYANLEQQLSKQELAEIALGTSPANIAIKLRDELQKVAIELLNGTFNITTVNP